MKKFLLITITSLLSFGAYAQVRELNCTEQAASFKINIPSGGHGYSAKIGRLDPSQVPSGFRFSNIAMQKKVLPDAILAAPTEESFSSYANYFPTNVIAPKKMTFLYQKVNSVTGKFTSTTYDRFKLLPMANISTLAPVLN
jgi:hypothetical protein